MANDSVRARARRNATGIASTVVTGTWLAALFAGFEWWLAVLFFGYVVVVPVVAMLFDDADDWEDWVREDEESYDVSDAGDSDTENNAAALERLRERYANGELTEDQFERKLEQLLRTETLEDVEDQYNERPDRNANAEHERG